MAQATVWFNTNEKRGFSRNDCFCGNLLVSLLTGSSFVVPCFVPRAGQPSEEEGGGEIGGGGGGGGGDSEPVLVLYAQLVLHWLITMILRCGLL